MGWEMLVTEWLSFAALILLGIGLVGALIGLFIFGTPGNYKLRPSKKELEVGDIKGKTYSTAYIDEFVDNNLKNTASQ